jgi:hypothetical protein
MTCFWRPKNLLFFPTHSPSEISVIQGLRPSKTALIQGKTALMFLKYFNLLFIWLFGTKSTQKITANSTYWKAKLKGAGGVARSKGKKGLFSRSIFPARCPKKPVLFLHPFSVGDLCHTRFPTLKNSTNSQKNSTNVFIRLHSTVYWAIRDQIDAENRR